METIEGVYGQRSKSSTLRHLCIKGGEEIEALDYLDKAIAGIDMVAHTIQIKQQNHVCDSWSLCFILFYFCFLVR